MSGRRNIRAPRGTELSCKGWQQEAAHADVDEQPRSGRGERSGPLVVYGGTGRAARSWEAYDAIVKSLRESGKRLRRCWFNRESRLVNFGHMRKRRGFSSPIRIWWANGRISRSSIGWNGLA